MRTVLVALAVVVCSGCAGRFEAARLSAPVRADAQSVDRAMCRTLDDRAVVWGAIATGTAVVAGGAGLSTIPVKDDEARIGIAIGAAVTAVLSGVSTYVSGKASEAWVREGCAP